MIVNAKLRLTCWAAGLLAAALGLGAGCTAEPRGTDTEAAGSSTAGETSTGTSTGEDPGDTTAADITGGPSSDDTVDAVDSSSDSDGGSSSGSDTGMPNGDSVLVETSLGAFVITLDPKAAPITVANFVAYVEAGFYDGGDGKVPTIMHRVIPSFMAQGGGLSAGLVPKATMAPIVNEHGNGLTNVRGAVAMARTNDPDSATAQFFVNVADNDFLDDPPGYAVFGTVTEGMEVVDNIVAVETEDSMGYGDVPVQAIVITSMMLQ